MWHLIIHWQSDLYYICAALCGLSFFLSLSCLKSSSFIHSTHTHTHTPLTNMGCFLKFPPPWACDKRQTPHQWLSATCMRDPKAAGLHSNKPVEWLFNCFLDNVQTSEISCLTEWITAHGSWQHVVENYSATKKKKSSDIWNIFLHDCIEKKHPAGTCYKLSQWNNSYVKKFCWWCSCLMPWWQGMGYVSIPHRNLVVQ